MESLRASRRQSLRATLRSIIENGRPINPHVSRRVLFKTPVNIADNQGCRVFETEFECNGNEMRGLLLENEIGRTFYE